MELKPGLRLKSAVCSTEVMVVKGKGEYDLRCGGQAMNSEAGELDQAFSAGTLMGKRYVSDDGGMELLCTKPGDGSLSLQQASLTVKQTQALPSSD